MKRNLYNATYTSSFSSPCSFGRGRKKPASHSVLLTFDFRSSRRGGRHHVRLEYQLPIRSENGTTISLGLTQTIISAESYSCYLLIYTITYYNIIVFFFRLNTRLAALLPQPPSPPPRVSFSSPQAITLCLICPCIVFKSKIANDHIILNRKSAFSYDKYTHTYIHIHT